MLTPAQLMSGIASNSPSNIGFLAYNWYNQYVWYTAAKENNLHALSLLPIHFNTIYAYTYLGGITSGNIPMAVILGLGTAGLIILNSVASWMSWATALPEGYGIYQFFFFGWRTLTPGWRTFFLLWQIANTIIVVPTSVILAILLSIYAAKGDITPPWYQTYFAIIWGPPLVLCFTWELILWVELVVSRNDIESETDMIAVWLFVAQVVLLLMPDPWPIIAATLKRIRLAMSNLWTHSTTSDVLPKHGPSEASAVIQLEEGAQQNPSGSN